MESVTWSSSTGSNSHPQCTTRGLQHLLLKRHPNNPNLKGTTPIICKCGPTHPNGCTRLHKVKLLCKDKKRSHPRVVLTNSTFWLLGSTRIAPPRQSGLQMDLTTTHMYIVTRRTQYRITLHFSNTSPNYKYHRSLKYLDIKLSLQKLHFHVDYRQR